MVYLWIIIYESSIVANVDQVISQEMFNAVILPSIGRQIYMCQKGLRVNVHCFESQDPATLCEVSGQLYCMFEKLSYMSRVRYFHVAVWGAALSVCKTELHVPCSIFLAVWGSFICLQN